MRRFTKVLLAGIALAIAPMAPLTAVAQVSELSIAYNNQTDADFRKGLQIRLAWTGDYVGAFDGVIDAASLRAIRDFQARLGMTPSGIIDEAMLELLIARSNDAEKVLGITLVDDAATGARAALPLGMVRDFGATEVGNLWRSADEAVEIETVRIADTGQTLKGLFDVLSQATETRSVSDAEFGGVWFVLRGQESGRSYVMRFAGRDGDLRGLSISYTNGEAGRMAPYAVVASNLFEPFAGEPQAPLVASNEAKPFSSMLARKRAVGAPEARYAMAYSDPNRPHVFELPGETGSGAIQPGAREFDMAGTGFVVSRDGWLLTNAHVVKACRTVLVGDLGAASQTIIDTDNDLALIKVDGALGEPLEISAGKPRLGEDILALGYPLRSILADSLNVTRGNVSSLLGLMNDPRYLQISAAVQPGNSGGPLVDLAGRVVGVVTAKLNAVAVADATGDIPQSINFAIRPDAAIAFLHANGIAFETADASEPLASVPDATAEVKDSILPILCVGS
ncbi:MAG TPA: trypsin-like serine protease [Aurantimonas coralicida]|uniref:Trypsin-like serine protease n=2 Tax=root TaxID=1 RepID=A0A9C9NJY3_9HYPH|nr:trypsin-like serine protease [Aurantimonas coralicida]HEU03087.1 trypsin-like serine protease [Aurantimonas coralicida]